MLKVTLITSAIVVFAFALVGPIGSYSVGNPLQRAAYAALCTSVGCPVLYSLSVVTLYFLRFRKPIEVLAALVLVALFAAFPITAWTNTVDRLALITKPREIGSLEMLLLVATSAVSCTVLYFYVLWQRVRHVRPAADSYVGRDRPTVAREAGEPTTAAATEKGSNGQPPSSLSDISPIAAVEDESTDEQDGSTDSPTHLNGEPAVEQATAGPQQLATSRRAGQPGALLKLLPDRLGTDLVYIKSEDHYLEVHTTVGSSLVKVASAMRFSEAVAERHSPSAASRSIAAYWVATSHVIRSVRSGKRTVLRLTGDHKVPVSVLGPPNLRPPSRPTRARSPASDRRLHRVTATREVAG